ncbi:MAG TPA: recombination mediator RecR [bacterium]|nr:recombination mediator RecR [bacterium]HQG44698.1 recombination mediator RecR [bacterium]HQI47330.1 recombination mediator RecR [bacterium]HQJ63395.1 recombination mediator RecR [bacterium]
MNYSSEAVERAIHELSKMPGIGRKSAQRLVFFLLKRPAEEIAGLAQALNELHEKVRYCSHCFNITEQDPCPICSDERRDRRLICVVEEANDVVALEKTGEFRGLYHVLGGALSPLDGVGPDDLKIRELLVRLPEGVEEVILATNPNTEGEATALYLARLLKPMQIKLSRIARGIPVGADIEYADEMTLARAMAGRVPV